MSAIATGLILTALGTIGALTAMRLHTRQPARGEDEPGRGIRVNPGREEL